MLTSNKGYKGTKKTMQLSNTKNKTFEAKTKLQLSLVSIPNMEITTH